jgi:hypothetical protein
MPAAADTAAPATVTNGRINPRSNSAAFGTGSRNTPSS